MPGFNEAAVGSALGRGAARAEQIASTESPFDVWSRTAEGIGDSASRTLSDPAEAMRSELGGRLRQARAALPDQHASQSVGDTVDATVASAGGVMDAAGKIAEADGALATTGAVFGTLTAIEQMLSVPFSVIPTPALPAVRITDQGIGLPHAHAHPPNLTPPNPVPVPLPSAGPVIPIPFLSGASRVLINGIPAARCGDMGIGIWCGGYFPMYEIFLGSSSVWLEGARAARIGVDITKHCIFTTPKPSDPPVGPMIGSTVSSSPNVSIGGFPLPSLTSLAIGAAFKAVFKGIVKLRSMLRAADDVVEEAAEGAGKVGKTADDLPFSRQRALQHAEADPARRVLGPARISHPEEIAQMRRALDEAGVEVIEREGAMAYAPGLRRGQPGQFFIDPNASYSAWSHEYQHFLDDQADGWRGMEQLFDNDLRWSREQAAYAREIEMMEQMGHQDVADELRHLRENERQTIFGERDG